MAERKAKKEVKPCPDCGRCPTCGHSPRDAKPPQIIPMPYPVPTPQPQPWGPYRRPWTITYGLDNNSPPAAPNWAGTQLQAVNN